MVPREIGREIGSNIERIGMLLALICTGYVTVLHTHPSQAMTHETAYATAQSACKPESSSSSRKPETRRTEAHSQRGIHALVEGQTALGEERVDDAIAHMTAIIDQAETYKGIDVAIAYKFRGYAYVSKEVYKSAFDDMQMALHHPSSPRHEKAELSHNMALLLVMNKNYAPAGDLMDYWKKTTESMTNQQARSAVLVYGLVGQQTEALNIIRRCYPRLEETYEGDLAADLKRVIPLTGNPEASIQSFFETLDASYEAGRDERRRNAPPLVLKAVSPKYPDDAADQGVEGWVKLGFDVTKSGKVKNVKVLESQPAKIFDKAAVKALKKWTFSPKLVESKKTKAIGEEYVINFEIEK